MRSTVGITMIGLAVGLGGCALAVDNTESLLSQAGFTKIPADTPKRAEHLQTLAAHRLIKRTGEGKSYYVYADPSHCKCMFVGNESAYAVYKGLVQRQEEAQFLEEQRQEESVQGVK
jgi:hypothetical protein